MKTLFTVILNIILLAGFSQTNIGMSKVHTITPAAATTVSVGTNYGNTITVTCYVKNKGTVAFSGRMPMRKRVDTLNASGTTVILDSLSVTNLAPNDSVQYIFIDTITPSTYKVYGNGNTIVVWPFILGNTADTLSTIPVYVYHINGIEELSMKRLLIYPNPTSQKLFIKPESGIVYDKLVIYDIQMKKIREEAFTEEVDISVLPQGTYWINVITKNRKTYTAIFTKTE